MPDAARPRGSDSPRRPVGVALASPLPVAASGGGSSSPGKLMLVLDSSGSMKEPDNIAQGETLTYRVHLDWGQSLSAHVKFPALDQAHSAAISGSPFSEMTVFNPARVEVEPCAIDIPVSSLALVPGGGSYSTAAGPVALRNDYRAGDAGAKPAGDYTLTVFMERRDSGQTIPIPFTLSLGSTARSPGCRTSPRRRSRPPARTPRTPRVRCPPPTAPPVGAAGSPSDRSSVASGCSHSSPPES